MVFNEIGVSLQQKLRISDLRLYFTTLKYRVYQNKIRSIDKNWFSRLMYKVKQKYFYHSTSPAESILMAPSVNVPSMIARQLLIKPVNTFDSICALAEMSTVLLAVSTKCRLRSRKFNVKTPLQLYFAFAGYRIFNRYVLPLIRSVEISMLSPYAELQSGLQPGDRIISVNGQLVNHMSTTKIRNILDNGQVKSVTRKFPPKFLPSLF